MSRYARQQAVRSVGKTGQRRIEAGRAEVLGSGLDAQICALYLAGAGLGTLVLHGSLIQTVREINSEIALEESKNIGRFGVRLNGEIIRSDKESPVGRGSQVARDVLAHCLRTSQP